jgi:hypothetical protein
MVTFIDDFSKYVWVSFIKEEFWSFYKVQGVLGEDRK